MNSQEIKILIVEDEPILAKGLEITLEALGYNVLGIATNGSEAIVMRKTLQPDLIFMDVEMPIMNGIEATSKIMQENPLPIIIISAYDSDDFLEECSKAGVAAYLLKPANPREIKRSVKIAIDRHNDRLQIYKLVAHQQEMNDKLEDALANKNKFLRILGHDLKGPVGGIQNLVELLLEKWSGFNEERKLHTLRLIQESTNHTFQLLSTLLDWTKIESGSLQAVPKKHNVAKIIESAINTNISLIIDKSIHVNKNTPPFLHFFVDEYMVIAIFRNIINNAIKYSNQNGKIDINAYQSGNNVLIQIKDNGVGMDDSVLERLFSLENYRSLPGTKGEKGTGLGLIMVKEFIEANRGTINVKSTLGSGTDISLSFPTA